jgi:hypothetical protein
VTVFWAIARGVKSAEHAIMMKTIVNRILPATLRKPRISILASPGPLSVGVRQA